MTNRAGGETSEESKLAERSLGATNYLWWGAATLVAELMTGAVVVGYSAVAHNPLPRATLIAVMAGVGAVGGCGFAVTFWRYCRRVRRVHACYMRCCVGCMTEFAGDAAQGPCAECGRAYGVDATVDAWRRTLGMGDVADRAAAERKAATVDEAGPKRSSLFDDV